MEFGGDVKLKGVAICIKIRRHKLDAELNRAAKSERNHAIKWPLRGILSGKM